MKNVNTIGIYLFLIIGFVLILANSCKKDNTNQTPPANTVYDIDGNVYHTVTIGTQCWMLENLKTTRYRNGVPITNVTDSMAWGAHSTGAYCNYNNETSNSSIYGRLYNYFAVADSNKLCPSGWHVPSDTDWIILTNYLGGYLIAGGKLKEAGLVHWASPNTDASNESGFTALPGGCRYPDGTFVYIGSNSSFWSSSSESVSNVNFRYLFYDYGYFYGSNSIETAGFSVRCVKD
ncbi:MAG: fibrobacter succinogenes major paralogous domain-containing protein [Bacteroidetes bacterium]|nr:fibrobacter succinogenes major paralogous domain-containing protein [Bacteroidota bacterium]